MAEFHTGKRLALIRDAIGCSKVEFAEKLGISLYTLGDWITNGIRRGNIHSALSKLKPYGINKIAFYNENLSKSDFQRMILQSEVNTNDIKGSNESACSNESNFKYNHEILYERYEAATKQIGKIEAITSLFRKSISDNNIHIQSVEIVLQNCLLEYIELKSKLNQIHSEYPILNSEYCDIKELRQNAVAALNSGDFEQADLMLKKELEINIEATKTHSKIVKNGFQSAAEILIIRGDLAKIIFKYRVAVSYYNAAYDLITNNPYINDSESLQSEYLYKSGECYRLAWDIKNAEKYLEQSLTIYKSLCPDELNEGVAKRYYELALIYKWKNKFHDARELMEKVFVIRKNIQPNNYPEIANTMNQIGSIYKILGNYDIAEEKYLLALDIQQKIDSSNQVYIIQSMEYLADLYFDKGDFEKADELYTKIMEIKRGLLGDDHPDIAYTLANWGRLFLKKKEYEEAEMLLKQSLEIRQKSYGERHSETAYSFHYLGVLYYQCRFLKRKFCIRERNVAA
jgi:tetratricopeptide (TPR) repeat protein